MYRVAPEETTEPEEAMPLPIRSASLWLPVVLLAVVALALGGWLGAVRWRLVQDKAGQAPVRLSVPTAQSASGEQPSVGHVTHRGLR